MLLRSTLLTLLAGASSLACATYTGSEVNAVPARIALEPGWVRVERITLIPQRANWDCGLAALSMVLEYWAIERDPGVVEAVIGPAVSEERPIRAGELRSLARALGAEAFLVRGTMEDLEQQLALGRPVLVGERKSTLGGSLAHYAVVIGVHRGSRRVRLLDPALGLRESSYEGCDSEWTASGRLTILVVGKAAGAAQGAAL
jgi:ABC-type bacteriocin/lantibiotic exporter with double-glycine peptidase domain